MADDSSWTPKQDMSLLCRVCANQHDYLIPIFEGEGLDHDMPTKMDKHLPITVRENDKLPTQMCYQCASTIIAWSELVTNCLEADKKLSRMLKINEKKAGTVALVDEDATSDHYEDAYDDVGGGDDYDDAAADDEDFEKEIKQLISDAGVELGSKTTKAKTTRATTRKRKSETVIVKKESKKSKTDTSVGKSSISLIKPKEEVTASDDRYNTCEHCQIVFPSKSEMIIHKEQQHPVEHFVCDYCKETFLVKTQLRRHIKWHGKSKAMRNFRTCPLCPEIFARYNGSKAFFNEHMRIVHNQKVALSKRAATFKLCTCDICGKLFKSQSKLNAHMLVHVEGKPFHCEETGCNAKFNQRRYLKRHMKHVHERVPLPVSSNIEPNDKCEEHPCETCGKVFYTPKALYGHLGNCGKFVPCNLQGINKTEGVRSSTIEPCHICGRVYQTLTKQRFHNKHYHTPERQAYMKKHRIQYFKNRAPQVCPKCGSLVKNMNSHMRLHIDQFPCEVCERIFSRKDAYQCHMRVHTGEKPFLCFVCGRSFKQQGDRNKHMRKLHNIEPTNKKNRPDSEQVG